LNVLALVYRITEPANALTTNSLLDKVPLQWPNNYLHI